MSNRKSTILQTMTQVYIKFIYVTWDLKLSRWWILIQGIPLFLYATPRNLTQMCHPFGGTVPAESKLLYYEPVAVYPSSSSVSIHQTARHHIPKDHNLLLKSDYYLCIIYKYYSVRVQIIGASYSIVFEIAIFLQPKVNIFGFIHADRCM